MTFGGLGVLDSPNSSGWPPMVCQGWGPMDQLSKARTNNFLQAKYPTPQMPLPARPWFFQRVQNQDPNNTDPLSPCLLQTRQQNHLEEASLLYYLHYVSYLFNWTMQEWLRPAKHSHLNFHPPSKTTMGPLSSCLLKETRKTPFRGSVIFTQFLYLSALLCYLYYVSYLFQLEHAGQTQDLPKIHLSTSHPPPKQPRVLCHLVFWKKPEKTPFGARVIFIQFLFLSALLCYLYYVSYLFQLEHAGKV